MNIPLDYIVIGIGVAVMVDREDGGTPHRLLWILRIVAWPVYIGLGCAEGVLRFVFWIVDLFKKKPKKGRAE